MGFVGHRLWQHTCIVLPDIDFVRCRGACSALTCGWKGHDSHGSKQSMVDTHVCVLACLRSAPCCRAVRSPCICTCVCGSCLQAAVTDHKVLLVRCDPDSLIVEW
jgi:hypothetical protein